MKLIILLLLPSISFGQQIDLQSLQQHLKPAEAKHRPLLYVGSAVAAMTSGFFFRRAEIRKDDYMRYAARHPNADPQWANPQLSFRNKYENFPHDLSPRYFGSKSILVFTTDGFHMDNFIAGASMATSIGFTLNIGGKQSFKKTVIQSLGTWSFYSFGRFLSNAYYKKVD